MWGEEHGARDRVGNATEGATPREGVTWKARCGRRGARGGATW